MPTYWRESNSKMELKNRPPDLLPSTTFDSISPGNASDTGQAWVVALTPATDTKATFPDPSSPGILKYYYYTETKSLTSSAQPQGVANATAKTTFAVAAPTTTLTAKYQYAARITTDGSGPAAVLYLENTAAFILAGNPSAPDSGIIFSHPPVHKTTANGTTF